MDPSSDFHDIHRREAALWKRMDRESTSAYDWPWPRSLTPQGHPFGRVMGRFIQELRYQSGLNQAQLANALDTTQPAVSKLEHGRHLPSIGMLIRIGDATGIPIRLQANFHEAPLWSDTVWLWPLPPPEPGAIPRSRGRYPQDVDAWGNPLPFLW